MLTLEYKVTRLRHESDKENRHAWYQICLALLVSVSLIACGGESSSNDDDNDLDEISTRVIDIPDGGTITIAPNPEDSANPNSRQITTTFANGEEGSSSTFNCGSFSSTSTTTINGVEVDVCEQRS